jgi:gluconate 2-dehydrogenase gamma chain
MDRREALRLSTLLLGGTISASTMSGILAGCKADTKTAASDWMPAFVDQKLMPSLAELCEVILPAGKTPGAKDAKVERYIDAMLKDVWKPEESAAFSQGLSAFEENAKSKFGGSFATLSQDQKTAIVKELDDALKTRTEAPAQKPFYDMVKELTVTGYCTSEEGATKHLKYLPVPGEYKACIPFSEVGGVWAL